MIQLSDLSPAEKQVVMALALVGAVTLEGAISGSFERPKAVAGNGICLLCGYKLWDTPKRRMMRRLEEKGWIRITLAFKQYWYQLSDVAVDVMSDASLAAQSFHCLDAQVLLSAFAPERKYFGHSKATKEGAK